MKLSKGIFQQMEEGTYPGGWLLTKKGFIPIIQTKQFDNAMKNLTDDEITESLKY